VVAGVLAEVTLIACLRDAVNNFLALRAGEVLQLLGEAVEGVLSEPCAVAFSHASPLVMLRYKPARWSGGSPLESITLF